jgi:phosphoribosyl 1,2-cyclic phosphate phosphodiesterase
MCKILAHRRIERCTMTLLAVGGKNIDVHAVEPFQNFSVGPYQIYSLKANHAPETTALLYLIEREGRVIFYATGTGERPIETWDALENFGKSCDIVKTRKCENKVE